MTNQAYEDGQMLHDKAAHLSEPSRPPTSTRSTTSRESSGPYFIDRPCTPINALIE